MRNFFFFALTSVVLSACVSQKKYNELLADKVKADAENVRLNDELQNKKSQINSLEEQLNDEQANVANLKEELTANRRRLDSLQGVHTKLNDLYNTVVSRSSRTDRDLAEKQKQLLQIENDLELAKARNEELRLDLEEREAKVKELEQILADKERAVNELRQKVSQALLSFRENELTVEVKNGKVYVSLSEQLLFKSGSTQVDAKGVDALKKLADVLKENEDVSIMIEGHTDNVPVSRTSQYMNDNWDLSVLRATTILRILTKNGVKATNIVAAGKGEFSPVAENDLAEGRQKNRRTEIILTPKLDELFQILEAN